MSFDFLFILNSLLFGVGLAMDAFSVSVANGLREPDMPLRRSLGIAGTFGAFQALMPMLGWACVHTITETFQAFQPFIPWIALFLLLLIGGKMIWDGFHEETSTKPLHGVTLLIQGVATSIDALSVGFTIAEYNWLLALIESLIIGAVTLLLCTLGTRLGSRIGTKLSGRAPIVGGVILILIGIEIFVTGI